MGHLIQRRTPIEGLIIAATEPMRDERGCLARLYCEQELRTVLNGKFIRQVNLSQTAALGTVRGMHLQAAPWAEVKLIRCLRGRVWDVAVDLRRGSPTFRRWHAQELNPDLWNMMIVPEGCAHGFQTLTPDCEMLYLHTQVHVPGAEQGLHPADPMLAINWPLPIRLLSPKDAGRAFMAPDFPGFDA